MRFSTGDFAIVDLARKARPRISAQDGPLAQYSSVTRQLDHAVQPRVSHDQGPFGRWSHVMQVVEARQGYVADTLERRHFKDEDLRVRADVQQTVIEARALEQDWWVAFGPHFGR